MTDKGKIKPKLDDAERYRRFVETAEKVGASDSSEDFDRAFDKVVKPTTDSNRGSKSRIASKD